MNHFTSYLEIHQQSIINLRMSLDLLVDSYEDCKELITEECLSNTDLVWLEALAARFSRTLDLLTKQVLRSLDLVEYGEAGTLIDIVNRSINRGILNEDNLISQMKILRNLIAHEYVPDAIFNIYHQVVDLTPHLINYCLDAITYSQRFT